MLASLRKSPSAVSKSNTKPWIKLETPTLNDFNPWNENSTKNDKLASLWKSPSAVSELKLLLVRQRDILYLCDALAS